jgi:hypothetical protein
MAGRRPVDAQLASEIGLGQRTEPMERLQHSDFVALPDAAWRTGGQRGVVH